MTRKFTYLLALCCLGLNNYAQQADYTVATGTKPYAALQTPVAITQADVNGGGAYFSYDLSFPTFNSKGVFKGNNTTTLGAFVAYAGYAAVYDPDESHTIVYQTMLVENSLSLLLAANSSLSYQYEGVKGQGILKVEWKNMGLKTRHDSEFVSFQLWLDEKDNTITYHYGPRSLSAGFRFFSSIFSTLNTQFGVFDKAVNLWGNPTAPSVFVASDFNTMPVIDSVPEEGRYYKFTKKSSTGIATVPSKNTEPGIYPNPAVDVVNLKIEGETANYILLDAMGKTLESGTAANGIKTIDVSALAQGIYFVQVEQNNAVQTHRIAITR